MSAIMQMQQKQEIIAELIQENLSEFPERYMSYLMEIIDKLITLPLIDIMMDYDSRDSYVIFNLYFEDELMVELSCYLNDYCVLSSIYQYDSLLNADEMHIDIFMNRILNIINKTKTF